MVRGGDFPVGSNGGSCWLGEVLAVLEREQEGPNAPLDSHLYIAGGGMWGRGGGFQ